MTHTTHRTLAQRGLALACACLLGLLLTASPAEAAVVRGRLDHVAPNGARGPVPGIAVTLYNSAMGRSSPSYTDMYGMYYLNAPAGSYNLEVWVSRDPRVPPQVYPIQIFEPGTDIPPILI